MNNNKSNSHINRMTAIETNNLENLNKSNNTTIDDSKYLPIFPKATKLLLNSGNVVSSDRLKKRTNLNPEEEVTNLTQISFIKLSI